MISEQLYHEAQNIIEVYGIDTVATQFAQKVIESYKEDALEAAIKWRKEQIEQMAELNKNGANYTKRHGK